MGLQPVLHRVAGWAHTVAGTLRRFYHQLQIDLGETRSFLLTHYAAMIEPRNKRGALHPPH